MNSYTTHNQGGPRIAAAVDGSFVLVWGSIGSFGSDPDFSIQTRRVSSTGEPISTEVQVNQATLGNQSFAEIARLPSGEFVVVWQSQDSYGSDVGSVSIQGRRLTAVGAPIGDQFQINALTTSNQIVPAISAMPDGGYFVTWTSYASSGDDSDESSIQVRQFGPYGEPLGGESQVNQSTTGKQRYSRIARGPEGDFLVVWGSESSDGDDQDGWSVQARRVEPQLGPTGLEFQVNSYTPGWQEYPDVASDGVTGFVVTWHSFDSHDPETGSTDVRARRYDADLVPVGSDFQVNVIAQRDQVAPRVAARDDGSVLFMWNSIGAGACPTAQDSTCVVGRWFDSAGEPQDSEFQLNSLTAGNQFGSSVGFDSRGDALVGWSSTTSTGNDNGTYSGQARRLTGLFRDGFESGDLARWSSALGRSGI